MLLHSTPYIYVNLFNFSYHVGAFYSLLFDRRAVLRVVQAFRFRVVVGRIRVDKPSAFHVVRAFRFRVACVDIKQVLKALSKQPSRHIVGGLIIGEQVIRPGVADAFESTAV